MHLAYGSCKNIEKACSNIVMALVYEFGEFGVCLINHMLHCVLSDLFFSLIHVIIFFVHLMLLSF